MGFCIAIDGPSGAGKTTLAKRLAKKLGFLYVDTGAMYRTVGLCVLNNNIDIYNEQEVVNCIKDINISIEYLNDDQQIFLNGKNVSNYIRTPEVSQAGSITSSYKAVREKLLQLQRDLAINNDVVMDGRDIGTNVVPNAQIKIFLNADVNIRAKRRKEELLNKGIDKSIDEVKKEIEQRDLRDSTRENNPLRKAADAIGLDSTNLTVDEEVEKIFEIYINKLKK